MIEATIAPFSFSPRIEIVDHSVFDPMEFGAVANGRAVALEEKFGTFEAAKKEYPFAQSMRETVDWAAWQSACHAARDRILATLAPGGGIGGTGVSWSPPVVPSPGRYVFNRPVMIYPHTTLTGRGWGVTDLVLADTGWAQSAPRLTTNPDGTVWCGKIIDKSALLWMEGDVREGASVVAGMRNSITGLGLISHDGPCMLIPSNQNHLTIRENHLSGWGNGPTGIGLIINNATSSSQQTNLQVRDNVFEGLVAALVADKLDIAHLCDNQIESCQAGFFVAHGDSLHASDNIFTNRMKQKPFKYGIHVGVANSAKIIGNIFDEVEEEAIKVLGDTTIALNDIRVKNSGRSINKSGYGIHVVGPAKQFGGNTAVLAGKDICHTIYGNKISCDQWPKPPMPNLPPLQSIWIDAAPGEKLIVRLSDNVDGPNG